MRVRSRILMCAQHIMCTYSHACLCACVNVRLRCMMYHIQARTRVHNTQCHPWEGTQTVATKTCSRNCIPLLSQHGMARINEAVIGTKEQVQ